MSPDRLIRAVSPLTVLQAIAGAIPEGCKRKMIVIGSLAVGYNYRDQLKGMAVRTKDADCLLSPRVSAIDTGVRITQELMSAGWKFKGTSTHLQPGTESTPDNELPAVRLTPPNASDWFLELLTVPEHPDHRGQRWIRLVTNQGHFGLCSFGFLFLVEYKPIMTDLGICIGRPEMMALANLLEHPVIKPDTMSNGFAGRMDIKRSNKDLGRAIAIARLATGRDDDVLLNWPVVWKTALQNCFPDDWRILSGAVGQGLRKLLASEPDLEQAFHTCAYGLLASNPPDLNQFRISGERLLEDAIIPLESESDLH